jgi:phospholipase D1/2
MMQFITALEKTAAACNYSKPNRFASFAPIRLNVAAQWLVDGVHFFFYLGAMIRT